MKTFEKVVTEKARTFFASEKHNLVRKSRKMSKKCFSSPEIMENWVQAPGKLLKFGVEESTTLCVRYLTTVTPCTRNIQANSSSATQRLRFEGSFSTSEKTAITELDSFFPKNLFVAEKIKRSRTMINLVKRV